MNGTDICSFFKREVYNKADIAWTFAEYQIYSPSLR